MNLNGKVAIVTGSSKGIGAEIARKLATYGASVVVNYVSGKEEAESLVLEIQSNGGKAISVQANVSKSEDVERLFKVTKESFGTISVLVNNAGVFSFSPVENISETDFHKMFEINVWGIMLTTQEALKYFPESGGSIINISSVAGQYPGPYTSLYASTKAAANAITISLSKELGARNIRVNAVAPGITDTEGTRKLGILGTNVEEGMIASTPLGRIGRPEDIAPIVAFLASEEASWITGEIIGTSGGAR